MFCELVALKLRVCLFVLTNNIQFFGILFSLIMLMSIGTLTHVMGISQIPDIDHMPLLPLIPSFKLSRASYPLAFNSKLGFKEKVKATQNLFPLPRGKEGDFTSV